jgi:hypothetical protein
MLTRETFDQWREWAQFDDWHTRFVGSDIRVMLGEIARLRAVLLDCKHGAEYPDELGDRINAALGIKTTV